MKKIVVASIVFCMLNLCLIVAQAATNITNINQFNSVFSYYFYKKDTSQLPAIINYINTNTLPKNAKPNLQGFFMGILHENPTAFSSLEKMNISTSTRSILLVAKEFSYDMESILNNKQNYYPESGAFLDMMWGYYFATGDNRVINKMCAIQKTSKNPLIQGAAKWSYDSNRKTYKGKIKSCQ